VLRERGILLTPSIAGCFRDAVGSARFACETAESNRTVAARRCLLGDQARTGDGLAGRSMTGLGSSSSPTGRTTMDISDTTRRAYELISAGDIDGFGELMADDFVEHEETPGLAPTKDGVLEFFRMYCNAFPDLRMDAEEVLVSGDKTVTRARASGTHQGELMGMPPTGKRVDVQLIDIMQFNDAGVISEHWGLVDMLSMMQQLGAIPEGPPA